MLLSLPSKHIVEKYEMNKNFKNCNIFYWNFLPLINIDYFNQKKQKTAKELWDYDKNKIDLIIKNGYNLEVVWESQLKENPKLINQIIKKYDTRE